MNLGWPVVSLDHNEIKILMNWQEIGIQREYGFARSDNEIKARSRMTIVFNN
jgi:hypothetical protein